jgi:hypothetical protein
MLTIIRKTKAVKAWASAALCATLFSFSVNKGGEGFEIYLNGKLVLQQYGNQMNDVKNLQLDQRSFNDQLTVKYYHCGRVGRNRVITLKDGQNKVLKEWRYADVTVPMSAMACNVKDILNLKKGNANTFKLYYSSNEIPGGRLLTTIVIGSGGNTTP